MQIFVRVSLTIIGAALVLSPGSEPAVRYAIAPAILLVAVLLPRIAAFVTGFDTRPVAHGVFRWTGTLPPLPATDEPDDTAEVETLEAWDKFAAGTVAKQLEEAIRTTGNSGEGETLLEADHGWIVRFQVETHRGELLIAWHPDGPDDDRLVFVAALTDWNCRRAFAGDRFEQLEASLHNALRQAFLSISSIRDVEWSAP